MIPEIGQFALIVALLVALVQGIVPMLGAARRDGTLMAVAVPAARAQFALVAIAFGCLAYSFVTSDFSVENVALHSNSQLPAHYRFAATWGSHEGSLLLWSLMLAGWGAAVTFFSRNLPQTLRARVLAVMGLVAVGFLLFLLATSNPFTRLSPPAPEGRDLNPLLQDPGMVVHPPMLYMGYVGFSVAFAFAIAALLGGRLDAAWARWSRPWTTVAWAFLTVGIMMGSAWAYYELGWGGWWFWDPVENASFMPWLVGTALIHSLAVTEKRGLFKSWTLLLAITAFSLSLLGTFLVRSGVLESVHAFASDPARGLFILAFLVVCIGGALCLYAWRAPLFRSNAGFKVISRESFLLMNNVLLVAAAGLILLGTLYPMILDLLGLGRISVGPPYFSIVFLVPMLPLAFLLALGMHASWKHAKFERTKVLLGVLLVAAIVLGVAIPTVVYGWHSILSSVGIIVAVWIAASSLIEPIERWRKGHSLSAGVLGMCVAHFGLAMFILGATTVESYKHEKDLSLRPGQSTEVAGFTFTLNSFRNVAGPNYQAVESEVAISRNGRQVATLYPQKRTYRVQRNPMTESGIDVTWGRDLFVAMGEPLGDGSWSLRLQYKPLVRFIWLGALVIAIGGFIAICDRRYRQRVAVEAGSPAAAGTSTA
jgi:cytochrome c-type biogenesis protein CcmF